MIYIKESVLEIWKRRIFGSKKVEEIWIRRTNIEGTILSTEFDKYRDNVKNLMVRMYEGYYKGGEQNN